MASSDSRLTEGVPHNHPLGEFGEKLSWNLNELAFRAKAALAVLHGSNAIDCDDEPGLALSYLLGGIANRAEELAEGVAAAADEARIGRSLGNG